MDKLKPCPFCGRKINLPTQPFLKVDHDYFIGCEECEVFFIVDTKEKAIEIWNKRAED